MTERFHFHFSLSCIGEGNGNTLQCSCLESPRDGGVYGVAQSWTRLKWLSCSNSRACSNLSLCSPRSNVSVFTASHSFWVVVFSLSFISRNFFDSLLISSVTCWLFAAAKSLQSCLTLCDPIDGSPPGFPVPGSLQARTLEWVAISFSNAWK